jgi:hypothetical protein
MNQGDITETERLDLLAASNRSEHETPVDLTSPRSGTRVNLSGATVT